MLEKEQLLSKLASQVNNTDDSDEEDNSTINNQDRATTRRGRAIKVPTRYQS